MSEDKIVIARAVADLPPLTEAQHLYVTRVSAHPQPGMLEVELRTIDLKAVGLVSRLKKMLHEELKDRTLISDDEVADAEFHVRALERIVGLVMLREQQDREHARRMAELREQRPS